MHVPGEVHRVRQDDVVPDAAIVAEVNERLCAGCGICVSVCPYEARVLDPERRVDAEEARTLTAQAETLLPGDPAGAIATLTRAVLLDPVLFTPAMIGVMALSDFFGMSNINDLAKRARRRRQRWSDRAAAYADFHGRGVFKGWSDDALRAYVDHALKDVDDGVALKCQPAQEAAIFSSYPQGLWSALRRIRTPTLVLHGERSFPFVHKSTQRWCRMNHAASAHRVPGGHCFMQEHPADTARRIAQFLLR